MDTVFVKQAACTRYASVHKVCVGGVGLGGVGWCGVWAEVGWGGAGWGELGWGGVGWGGARGVSKIEQFVKIAFLGNAV